MASFNRIIMLGNLTRDPQLSYTGQNTAVCKFGLATNRRWKDQSGEMREETCFADCTLFGRGGETFNQYMKKGNSVLIEGRLQYQQWTTPDGQKRSKHEVIVENFQFMGGRGDGSANDSGGRPEAAAGARSATAGRTAPPSYDEVPPPSNDDIPF